MAMTPKWVTTAPTLAKGSSWTPVEGKAFPTYETHPSGNTIRITGKAYIARTADHHVAVKVASSGTSNAIYSAKRLRLIWEHNDAKLTTSQVFKIDNNNASSTYYCIFDAKPGDSVKVSHWIQSYNYSKETWETANTYTISLAVPEALFPTLYFKSAESTIEEADSGYIKTAPNTWNEIDTIYIKIAENQWVEAT